MDGRNRLEITLGTTRTECAKETQVILVSRQTLVGTGHAVADPETITHVSERVAQEECIASDCGQNSSGHSCLISKEYSVCPAVHLIPWWPKLNLNSPPGILQGSKDRSLRPPRRPHPHALRNPQEWSDQRDR
eukprot:962295-Amphidinium_carterae.1